jgi:hypothetical protein
MWGGQVGRERFRKTQQPTAMAATAGQKILFSSLGVVMSFPGNTNINIGAIIKQ